MAHRIDDPLENNQIYTWKGIYLLGGIATILALAGILLDIVFGSINGGNLTALPLTAVDRFIQFQTDPLLGLYNLDLLNAVNQIIMIPVYFAVFAALRRANLPLAALGLVIFLVGSVVFITNNTALPMLELARKYAAASTEPQRLIFSAAGEAMLARGMHGSAGVFPGFLIPNIGSILLAGAMLDGKVFSRIAGIIGVTGSALLIVYTILVTFLPSVKEIAMAVSMPGGLLMMAWLVMITIKLFRLAKVS